MAREENVWFRFVLFPLRAMSCRAAPKANAEALRRKGGPMHRPAAPKANAGALQREGIPMRALGRSRALVPERLGAEVSQ